MVVSCEFGVVEIKCPYSCKDKSFLEATAESTFFLKRNDGVTNLKTNHTYFHRVQAQMKFCRVTYCNFVVWREEELFVQRIYPNEKFMATALEKVTSFIKLGVLPELLGKWYSKAPVSSGMGTCEFWYGMSNIKLKTYPHSHLTQVAMKQCGAIASRKKGER